MTLACDLSVTVTPAVNTIVPLSTKTVVPGTKIATLVLVSATSVPTTVVPTSTPHTQPWLVESTKVAFGRLSFAIPPSAASGASGKEYSRFDAEDAAYWRKTPGHLQVNLAVFPIVVPVLAETDDPGAAIPPGGIEYRDMSDPNADFPNYYASITALLNATANEDFFPSNNLLDLLIQSMQIIP